MSYAAQPTYEDWLRGWREWARTRKRGKMAQFIVDKLENSKQAHWVDITIGKFELTEWHVLAEEWFKEKPRNSDQVDAPCMLRKGLPRAFPGLEEVKSESVKEGTQYRSRVFQATHALVQEVLLHVNNRAGLYPDISNNTHLYQYPHQPPMMNAYQFSASTSSGQMPTHQPPMLNGTDVGYSFPNQQFTFTSAADPSPPPSAARPYHQPLVKLEEYTTTGSPSSDHMSGSPGYSPYASTTTSRSPYVGMQDGGMESANSLNHIAQSIASGQGSPYTLDRSSSPFSTEGPSPGSYHNHSPANHQMLQIPVEPDAWSNASGGSTHGGSPRYSPEPSLDAAQTYTQPAPLPQVPVAMPSPATPQTTMFPQEGLQIRAFPNRSPLEGGEQLCLLFSHVLPEGNKWISFVSQQRSEYTTTVEAYQENSNTLTTIIPRHPVAETVLLQIVCNGQVIAQSDFTYFGDSTYYSEMLFQFLSHNMPTYFQQSDLGLGGVGGGGAMMGGGLASGGYGYSGGIPSSTFGLLLGGCRLGLEPFVYATLQLPAMAKISSQQLGRARELAEEFGHEKLARVLGRLERVSGITARGGEEQTRSPEFLETLEELDRGGETPEDTGSLLMSQLVDVARREKERQAEKEEEEEERSAPSSPTVQPPTPEESTERVVGTGPKQPRRTNSGRLRRQQHSVRDDEEEEEEEEVAPETHSRRSLEEVEDRVTPLVSRQRFNTGSFRNKERKMLIATHSDADSAVSMSFDRDEFESEIQRRGSSSMCSSGLFSLNLSDQGVVNVTIDEEAGYTFANSVQYECTYLVTEDYPPGDDTIFRAGDRIVAINDVPVRDKGPEDFHELLQTEARKGTTVRIIPRLSPPPSSLTSSLGYGSLDVSEKRLIRRQSEQTLLDAITMKVSNLLSMKTSDVKRSVVIPYHPAEGYGFKMIGGNAVGLFVSEVRGGRKEIAAGDQILEINGQDARHMTNYEATQLLRQSRDKINLVVMENNARFLTIREQFEFDSFYLRSQIDHSSTDPKDMRLQPGSVMRVVNTILYGGQFWLAWAVDEAGMDAELRRIPSPHKAKQLYGKDAYQRLQSAPRQSPFSHVPVPVPV